jgi:polygalacturonase
MQDPVRTKLIQSLHDRRQTRRSFIKHFTVGTAAAFAGTAFWGGCSTDRMAVAPRDSWELVPEILARIQAPAFPQRDFFITNFGAVGDGSSDASEAIALAIEACSAAGGGRVVVGEGVYLTGPIHLRSNVNLHVAENATLRFSRDTERYLPAVFTRWEGMELMNYSPLIYAFEQENVAVTGAGTLDGNADERFWWPWKGQEEHGWVAGEPEQSDARNRLQVMVEAGLPVKERLFGDGDYLRPSFVQPYRCRNILVEGVTIVNSPMWEIHPVLCTNVTVRGVRVETHGPNNDGCNPESCRDVLIEDCYFDTGDDCIALKSGRNADGRRLDTPVENVIIQNCTMRDGHGGVVIGSEISGGARNIFVRNCQMSSPNLDRALRIKTNSVRGGVVEHIYMRDVEVGEVSDAVVRVNFLYEEGDAGNFKPIVRDVEIRNVTCERSERALYLRGYADSPITNVRLVDCRFENVADESTIEHVQGLVLDHVFINGELVG